MLKIRLQRLGRKNRAHFRIVVADARTKRQGAYLENLGHYDPHGDDKVKITANLERVRHWVGLGAQMTEKVSGLLKKRGLQPAAELPKTAATR